MDTNEIIKQLTVERDRIDKAIKLLSGLGAIGISKDGTAAVASKGTRKRPRLSAEARARIAAAQRKRWAKTKQQNKGA